MAKPTSDLLDGRPKVRLHVNSNTNLASKVDAAREAQRGWSKAGVKARLRIVRNIRHQIVERTDQLVASVSVPMRTTAAETIAAEIIPLADACRFLEHEAVSDSHSAEARPAQPAALAARRLRRITA